MIDVGFFSSAEFGALLFHVLLVWPMWRLYRRVGLPPAWALLALVPVFGLGLALAPLAVKRWPLTPEAMRPNQRRGAGG